MSGASLLPTCVRPRARPRRVAALFDGEHQRQEGREPHPQDTGRIGIHDIPRSKLDAQNELPGFNMPREVGLFLGAKRYGDPSQRPKACPVIDRERHQDRMFISDVGRVPSQPVNRPAVANSLDE